ncbi:hypothetical protein [Clostridium tyrobutyricum]|jgi:hypothetical protein|uniref:hypothetical protein n=1 Tax=Clostridium tyrobutyricum TaxID=1519 RepID=UPI000E84BD2A|nr:hypothetical protein [Clostridium tyrobutyricum]HBN28372.1 hypothetical protein [Clostridiaceae bacterium]
MLNIESDISYLIDNLGKPIKINNVSAIGLVGNIKNNNEDIRKLITKSPISRGDIVIYKDNNYLVTSDIDNINDIYYKAEIQKCPHVIKLNNVGTIKECAAILETKVMDIETGQYFPLAAGKMVVTIKNNVNVTLQQRFIKFGEAWNVTGIDKTKIGLIILNVEKATTNSNDDLENEIADRWQYETKHLYTIETTNTDTTIEKDKTLQFDVTVKDNDAIVENPALTYKSDNSNCTIDEKGLITGVNVGSSIITSTFTSTEGITKSVSINVTVTEPIKTDNFTYSLVGDMQPDTSIKAGSYIVYTAKKFNNGVEVADAKFDFEVIPGDTPSDAYTLTVNSDTECRIDALKYMYTIALRAKDRDDNAKYIDKEITLKGLW